MNANIKFDYFKSQESDMLCFYRIPKLLFTDDYFKKLCIEAKVLYGLMLDRISLSLKNKWYDADNRAYIYFSQQDAMEMLNCKENKVVALFKSLEDCNLIKRKKQGQGKPAIIYPMIIVQEEKTSQPSGDQKSTENVCVSDIDNPTVQTVNIPKSCFGKTKVLDLGKNNANYNNINNTDIVTSNHINLRDRITMDDYNAYADLIKNNIELDSLKIMNPLRADIIDGIYDLILETVLCKNDTIRIAQNDYPTELVKAKFLKLDSAHIDYVIECLNNTSTKIHNMHKYLLSALFNAPSTIGSYYQSAVNYDMSH